jgi:phage terminase large subunit
VFDEMYNKAMTNEDIAEKLRAMGYAKEKITADCAEPKSIDRLRTLGIRNIRASRKGRDSILNGIDYIRGCKIIIHPKCSNFIKEINNYQWEKRKNTSEGAKNKPVDEYNHLMDAMRYALEDYIRGETFSFE